MNVKPFVLVAALFAAGCAGSPPAATTPAPPTATPTPDASPTPAPPPTPVESTPSTPTPAQPAPSANGTAAAGGYVAPVFTAQDEVVKVADPGGFANVNPFEYQNPWRS